MQPYFVTALKETKQITLLNKINLIKKSYKYSVTQLKTKNF